MQYRCPSCGLDGRIRIPDHLPSGKKARIRCSRCKHAFALTLGRLWPQDSETAYTALAGDLGSCSGEAVGPFWVEVRRGDSGRRQREPLLVLQGHPTLPHNLMHDLFDPFVDYSPVCYVEFPQEESDQVRALGRTLALLRKRLRANRLHLVSHLATAPLALQTAAAYPADIRSLILLEPDLCASRRFAELEKAGLPYYGATPGVEEREDFLGFLFRRLWPLPLEDLHLRGLSRMLAPGFAYSEYLSADRSEPPLSYSTLSRIRQPVLIVSSKDGNTECKEDAQYLSSALPSAETTHLDSGGGMAAWLSTTFTRKIQSFKLNAEKQDPRGLKKKSQTAAGQPVGWMILLTLVITGGLMWFLDQVSYQPAYMKWAVPPFLGALLPMLWLLFPRKLGPLYLRFRGFNAGNLFLPLITGAFFGLAYTRFLQTYGSPPRLPIELPRYLISLLPGAEGRLYSFVSLFFVALLFFGFVENVLVIRRSGFQVFLPFLLFALIPPSVPDVLWRLPMALFLALIFRRRLSIFVPLFMLTGFYLGSELPLRYPQVLNAPFLEPLQAVTPYFTAIILLVLAAAVAILNTVSLKTADSGVRYFSGTLNRSERRFRWEVGIGIVLLVFSIVTGLILIIGFMLT